jgi:GTP-binding protein
MLPYIVIVGKPNVGKSTLFNRIVRRRLAITFHESHTTRDRIETEVEWQGRKFLLTDTGGYLIKKEEDFSLLGEQINKQILEAIRKADVIIFLVDGSGEPTVEDFEIVRLLRKERKSFILAVNKIDRKASEYNLPSYYQLGAEELIPISAEQGTGVDNLLDLIFQKFLPQIKIKEEIKDDKTPLRLLIAGRPNVGKSTFLNTILGEERAIVLPIPGTTRDVIEDEFFFENQRIRIVDTAGIRKKSKIKSSLEYFSVKRTLKYIASSDVVILLLDAQCARDILVPLTRQDLRIIDYVMKQGKGMVIAINKIDLVPKTDYTALVSNTQFRLRNFNFIPVMLISAIKGRGIKKVIRKAISVYEEGKKMISEDILQKTVLQVLVQRPPTFRTRKIFLKQVGILPPTFHLIIKQPDAVREDYIRFVTNEIRNYFGFVGNPIRVKVCY